MTPMQSQPGRAPTDPDDRSNYLAGRIFGQIAGVFVNGFPLAALFKKSIRTGSNVGTGLGAFDGLDGVIVSGGTNNGVIVGDRTTSAAYWLTYLSTGVLHESTSAAGGDVATRTAATGLYVQDALTALASRGTNVSGADVAGVAPSGSRIVRPAGHIYVQLALAITGTIAAGGTLCTLALAHRPTSGAQAVMLRKNNAPITGAIANTTGILTTDTALVNGDTIIAAFSFFP